MSLPFDPSDFTVANATEKLDGLSDEELDAVYEAEIVVKQRTTLLDAITAAREALRAPAPQLAAPAPRDEDVRAANRAAIKAAGLGGSYVGPSV